MEGLTRDRIFDLAVIGAGPGGVAAAITAARRGLDVVLLEAGSFPRHKVCGEFISGEALPMLESLLPTQELLADAPRIGSARAFLDDRVVEFDLDPAAVSLSRHALDLGLWKAATANGVCAHSQTRVIDVRKDRTFFALEIKGEELRARTVINASGRWSNLAGSKLVGVDRWIGLKQHFWEEDPSPHCDLYFFPGGYGGVQPLGNGLVNVAVMVQAKLARNLADVFALHRALAQRSRQWITASQALATSPLLFPAPRTSDGGIALVGDAAAFIDPFAGDGISMALHSGRLAALGLLPFLRGQCSLPAALSDYDRAHGELLQPALKVAARLRRLLQLPKTLRVAALSLLRLRPLARMAVQQTRVRKAG